MGKPRETSTDEDINVADTNIVTPQKRHKKHKHKRHKKKKLSHDEEDLGYDKGIGAGEMERSKKNSKVRGKKLEDIKGPERSREKLMSIASSSRAPFAGFPPVVVGSNTIGSGAVTTPPKIVVKKKIPKSGKGKDSGTSSEEERWLDAIESGKLEEVDDELKKIKPKDPKLMTARQRAMFERKTDTEPNPAVERLVSLPSGYKEKVMTAEAIQKAALKSLKRKQLADEKREKDKKKTMERLLKKQESKASKFIGKGKAWKRQVPLISYRMTVEGSWISLPIGQEFPLGTSKLKENDVSSQRREIQKCSVEGCEKPKKYSCSKTGTPLCSLSCYKANLAGILT